MNELTNIELVYESLVPIASPDNMFLSVGTVTLLSGKELNLDFNCTEASWYPKEDSYVELRAKLSGFEPATFIDEYRKMGLTPKDLNYFYFASSLQDTFVTEVYTEYFTRDTQEYMPLTLKSIQLHFADGRFIDYSRHITVFALKELAEAA